MALKWSKNTIYIVDKALSRVWTMRRLNNLGFPEDFILDVYTKEIRSILEFAVPVWNGALTETDCRAIEKVNKEFLKSYFMTNIYTMKVHVPILTSQT